MINSWWAFLYSDFVVPALYVRQRSTLLITLTLTPFLPVSDKGTSQNVISSKSLCKFCSTKSCSSGSVEPVFLLAQLLVLLVNKENDITPGLLATIKAWWWKTLVLWVLATVCHAASNNSKHHPTNLIFLFAVKIEYVCLIVISTCILLHSTSPCSMKTNPFSSRFSITIMSSLVWPPPSKCEK